MTYDSLVLCYFLVVYQREKETTSSPKSTVFCTH